MGENKILKSQVWYMMGCDGKTEIMVYFQPTKGWEVYYKRTQYPWLFAFGLPYRHMVKDVFDIANDNITQYGEVLFND